MNDQPNDNRVMVYRNLTKDCWSVKSVKTGRVRFHVDCITIVNGQFKVSESGRQRVIREKKKYVHAGVVGEIGYSPITLDEWTRVRYNPYTTATFVDMDNNPIHEASEIYLTPEGHVYMRNAA
jgi:hypothetical protein